MALQCKAPPAKPTPRPPPYPPTAANLACEQRLVDARAELKKASVAAMGEGGGGGGGFCGGDKRARLMATLARAAAHRARASDPEEKTKKLAKPSNPPKPVGLQRVTSASRSSHAAKDPCAGPSTSDPEEKTKKLQPALSETQSPASEDDFGNKVTHPISDKAEPSSIA